MVDDVLPPQGDECLLDVVAFPQAYTTSQKYEAELLKIIHTTGAPNGAFQEICSGLGWRHWTGTIFFPHHLPTVVKSIMLRNLLECKPVGRLVCL